MKKSLVLTLLMLSSIAFKASAASGPSLKHVSICDDAGEWPPFTYLKRVDGKTTHEVVGYSVDVIDTILKANHMTYNIVLLPWKRCLSEVQHGSHSQMLLNASYNQERSRHFLYSEPIYYTHPSYFYSKTTFPHGLTINKPQDFSKYQVCGLRGYNYSLYGLKPDQVDTNASTFDQLFLKLRYNHCKVFAEQYEIIAGFGVTHHTNFLAKPWVAHAPLPYLKPIPFYMMFTRNAEGQALQKIVDQGIDRMRASGKLKQILSHYMPESD